MRRSRSAALDVVWLRYDEMLAAAKASSVGASTVKLRGREASSDSSLISETGESLEVQPSCGLRESEGRVSDRYRDR